MSGFPLPVPGTLPPPFIWKAVQAAPLESASATGSAPGPWPSPDVALPPGKAGAAGCGGEAGIPLLCLDLSGLALELLILSHGA